MNYDERTMAAYLTDMMDGKVAAEATARAAGLTAEESARETALAAINTTLADKAEAVFGGYTGNGTTGRSFNLGFRPKFLLVGTATSFYYGGTLAVDGAGSSGYTNYLTLTNQGFYISNYSDATAQLNNSNAQYYYIAFR